MAKRIDIERLEQEVADAESLAKEMMNATIPDPDAGPKGVRGKYPPGVVANVKAKAKSLREELQEAKKKESPDRYVERKIRSIGK
jgi:hypothetical protein